MSETEFTASFIDGVLTPISIIAGFLLTVLMYLLNLYLENTTLNPAARYGLSYYVTSLLIIFLFSLISMNLAVSARIVHRFHNYYTLQFNEIITLAALILLAFVSTGVSFYVAALTYLLISDAYIYIGVQIGRFFAILDALILGIALFYVFYQWFRNRGELREIQM